ncbi:MAG: DUF4838 domain-containing protein [Lentisphaeria bacterium]|nr:DUF4838 domain-containing protein [Lentisphaeria bacterium]
MLKKSFFLCLLAAGAVTLSAAAPAGRFEPRPQAPRYCKVDKKKSLVLFENGKANFQIVYGKSRWALLGAVELANTLSRSLGVKVWASATKKPNRPAIIVGDIDAARKAGFDPEKMEWGAFRIKSAGNDIIIAGRDDGTYSEGTLYGVYDFLERFAGVRFYFPGEIGTITPKIKKWVVPAIDISDRPDMQTRTMYSVDPFPKNFHGGGPVRWYDTATQKDGAASAIRYYRIQRRSPFQSCHGLAHLALTERFAKTNPDYFALNQRGTREIGLHPANSGKFGHVCYSSEGLKKELILDAKAIQTGKDGRSRNAFRNGRPAWPNGDQTYGFFNVMPNDSAYYCQCEKCKPAFAELKWNKKNSLAASNLTWKFMADIANALKKDKVPGYVLTMSYAHYAPVPEIEIPDNMLVMLALTGPWSDYTPHAKKEQMTRLKAWRKKLGARPYVWNYATKFSARIQLVPNCTPRAFGRYYKEVGDDIFGAFLECETDYWIFGFMNYYIFGRMMWDKKADADAILAEHYKLMYGAGAPEMTRFFDLLEEKWMRHIVGNVIETDVGPVSSRPSEFMLWNEIYSPAFRKELDGLLKKAAVKCAKDPDSLKRIAFMRREFYDRLQQGAENYRKTTADVEAWKGYMPQLKAGEKITVDGKGTEKAWSAAPAHYLLPNSSVKSEAVEVRTFFKALRDKENFYFYVECEEPETAKMSSLKRKFDEFNIWEDNTIEIFLNPSGDRKTGYQMLFNSMNCLSDNRFKLKTMDWKWNSKAEHKVSVVPGKKWCLEVRIPRNTMEVCKERLIANVMRSRVIAEKRSPFDTWSPKINNSQYVDNYGILEFEPRKNLSVLPGGDFTEAIHSKRFLGFHRPIQWYNMKFLKKDTKIFRTGGVSLRMDKDTEGFTFYDLKNILKPDTSYRLTFYIKTQDIVSLFTWGGGVFFTLDCGMKPRKTIGFPKNNGKFVGTMPWTRQSFDFTTPKELGRDGRIYLSFSRINRFNDPKGIAWIDQVEIVELPRK